MALKRACFAEYLKRLVMQRRLRDAQEALRKAAGGRSSDEQPLLKQFLAQSDQLRAAVLQAAVDQQRVSCLHHQCNLPASGPLESNERQDPRL